MNCSVCGAMIPDGQAVCPNCGTAVQPVYQQPQQQMYQQPQQMYQQPQQPMYQQPQQQMYQQPMYQAPQQQYQPQGSANDYFKNPMNIVKFVSAIVLFLTPFFSWVTVKLGSLKESGNLIGDLDKKFVSIMIILLAIVAILWEVADFVPALGNIKAKVAAVPYIDLIIAGVIVLFVLIATITCMSHDEKASITAFGGKAYRSIGCWLAWIAAIAYTTPSVMKIVKK